MRAIKTVTMFAVGILLAYGGLQWTRQAKNIYEYPPSVAVGSDFNLTMETMEGEGDDGVVYFPAIFGVVCGIVWVICAFVPLSFPSAVWLAAGVMLIPVGVINLVQGFFAAFGDGGTERARIAQYPSRILRFLFLRHPFISVLIFAVSALVCIAIGLTIESAVKKAMAKNV